MPERSHDIPHVTPPDDVLLELGRLTWAAINLEDVVYAVCHYIEPTDDFREIPAGTRINQAREALQAQPDKTLRTKAEAWLKAAADALAERHAVLHSEPMTFVPLSDNVTPGNLDPLLVHSPRGGTRPQVNTPITVSGLRSLRWHIEAARARWVDLVDELYEKRVW